MAAENFRVKKGLEVGTATTITSEGVNVTGVITATQFKGDGSGLTGVVGSGSGVVVKDEGSAVGTAGTINFVGTGIAAAISEGTATVTVNAGGLDNVVEDTTPQLGGNLDLNSKDITGSGNIDITGNLDISGISTFGDHVSIPDDKELRIGNSADLKLVHSTSLSSIVSSGVNNFTIRQSAGSGFLFIHGDQLHLRSQSTNEPYLIATNNGPVSLYYDQSNHNTAKLVTTATGVTIDGTAVAGGLDISGDIDVDGQTELDDLNVSGITTLGSSASGSVVLKHGGNQKLTTTINGIEVPDLNATGVGTVGRLDTNGVTLGTNNNTFAAKFIDDAVINVGTSNDLQISHANDVSLIRDTRAGAGATLAIGADKLFLRNKDGNENYLEATDNGSVKLYHDFLPKFETDQAGVKITGVCTATSFSGDGSALTGITASGSGIIVKHDGSTVGTAGTINFSTNLDVSPISAGIVTVTASGGSGGIAGISTTGTSFFNQLNVSGVTTITSSSTHPLQISSSNSAKIKLSGSNNAAIQFQEGTTDKCFLAWDSSGFFYIKNQETNREIRLANNPEYVRAGTSYKIWNEYNDGSGSTLDADLLDGQEGSYYTNASNLGVGTIPNGRFPATLPAVSGANLTSLTAGNISGTLPAISGANLTSLTAGNISGTLSSSQIADEAITFAKMQHVGTGVLIGRNDSGSGDIETLTASEVRTLLNVADGATAGITTAPSNIVATWDVVNNGASSYRFTGPGQNPTADNPDIYLVRGNTYRFALSASGHPFQIRVSNGGSAYNDGVTNNGAQTGNVEFYVQNDAPASLVYQCTSHGGMVGNIYITGHQLTNGANNRVLTATSAYGINAESNMTFDGDDLTISHSGLAVNIFESTDNHSRLRIKSGSSSLGQLEFGDQDDADAGEIRYDHGNDRMTFHVGSNSERVSITGTGLVGVNETPTIAQFQVKSAQLGGTAGNTQEVLRLHSPDVSNITSYRFTNYRTSNGTSHTTSELRFRRHVDVTDMGYFGLGDGYSSIGYGTAEKVRIESVGRILVAHTSSQTIGGNSHPLVQLNVNSNQQVLSLARFENVVAGPSLILGKSRSSSAGNYTVVQNGDSLGNISFAGADGTDLVTVGALIEAQVDGTPGSNDMPGRLVFSTTADGTSSPTEKVRITSDSTPTLLVQQTSANADANGWTFRGAIQYSSCCFTSTDIRTMFEYTSYHSTGSKQAKVSIMTNGAIYSRYGTSLLTYSCERRTKKNIVDLDKTKAWNTLRDTPMYSWNYKKEIEGSKKHYGPIVDECPEDIIIPGIEEDEEGIINTVDNEKLQYRAYTALSEALKRIEQLEAEVAALKSS